MVALIFPGQGSQFVGMGKDLAEWSPVARHTMEEADETLDFFLSRMCFNGPEDDLKLTENTQPAILAVRADKAGDAQRPAVGEEPCDLSDAADVLGPVFG